jgi:hypothetical protein
MAAVTVKSKGWGVESRTMSTSRAASSASRSSEIAEVTTDLPRRLPTPKAASSSGVPTMTCASSSARRAKELLNRVPGAFTCERTAPGSWRTGHIPMFAARPMTGLASIRLRMSRRSNGSANSKLSVYSCRIRIVCAWFMPPSTTTRALVK